MTRNPRPIRLTHRPYAVQADTVVVDEKALEMAVPEEREREDELVFQRRNRRSSGHDDARLAEGELRHDEGSDRRGRWGMR